MAIFRLKTAVVCHLGFLKIEIVIMCGLKRVQCVMISTFFMRFVESLLSYGDLTLSLKMALVRHLRFVKIRNQDSEGQSASLYQIFKAIRSTVTEFWRFNDF